MHKLLKNITFSSKLLLAGVLFSTGGIIYVIAAPPTSPYTLGETLDPTCAPGDTNCSVDAFFLKDDATLRATIQAETGSGQVSGIRFQRGNFQTDANLDWDIDNDDGDLRFNKHVGGVTTSDMFIMEETGDFIVSDDIGIGSSSPIERLFVLGEGNEDSDIALRQYEDGTTENATVFFDFAEGTVALPTAPGDGQTVGHLAGRAWDTSAFQEIAAIHFKTDDVVGLGDAAGSIEFWITPGGSTTPINRMILNENGQLLLHPENLTYDDEELHIGDESGGGSSDTAISIENTDSGTSHVYEIHVENSDEFVIYENQDENSSNSVLMYNGNTDHWGFGTDPTVNEIATATGAYLTTGGVWSDSSSRELKTNIADLSYDEAARALELLNPVRFEYKRELGEEYLGFIAEDVPELVAMADRKGLANLDIVAVLVEVNQEQQKRIDQLEQDIQDLKQLIDSL